MMDVHMFDKIDLLAYVTGSCSDMKRAMIEKHLPVCDDCRAYCAGLEIEREQFLKGNAFAETITLSAKTRDGNKMHPLPFIGRQYYALAALLLVFVTAAFFYRSGTKTADYRIKGAVGLNAFVQSHNGDIEKRQDRRYHPGEKIQFVYSCDAARCFILFSIDTAGSIATYYPSSGDSSMVLESGQDIPLPNSIVLDDYTGKELFVGLFSKKMLAVSEVKTLIADAFAATRSMDSLPVHGVEAVVINYGCTIVPGDGK